MKENVNKNLNVRNLLRSEEKWNAFKLNYSKLEDFEPKMDFLSKNMVVFSG